MNGNMINPITTKIMPEKLLRYLRITAIANFFLPKMPQYPTPPFFHNRNKTPEPPTGKFPFCGLFSSRCFEERVNLGYIEPQVTMETYLNIVVRESQEVMFDFNSGRSLHSEVNLLHSGVFTRPTEDVKFKPVNVRG